MGWNFLKPDKKTFGTETAEESSEAESLLHLAGMLLVILAAGVVHGMFVSGGALLVIYASGALKEKEEFRATMAMLWVPIGCYLTGNQISVRGRGDSVVCGHLDWHEAGKENQTGDVLKAHLCAADYFRGSCNCVIGIQFV